MAADLRTRYATAALLATLASPGPAAAETWRYTIGEERGAQQANLCASRETALEVAEIFRRYGPKPGYAVLSHAPGCRRAVRDITPTALLAEIPVGAGEPGAHHVRFVEVRLDGEERAVLVTTREVAPAR